MTHFNGIKTYILLKQASAHCKHYFPAILIESPVTKPDWLINWLP